MRTAHRTRAPHPGAAPYAAAYGAFARVFPELRIRLGPVRPDEGWLTTGRLLADPALQARVIATETRQARLRYGTTPRPDVAAGFWLHRYTWPLCLLFTLPWLLEQRVPLPAAEQLAFRHPSCGGPAELALPPAAPHRFACLPTDPAARHPGAHLVPDQAALGAALRGAVAEQLDPLLAAFRPHLRRGPRTLWGLATDELVESLWYAAGLLGLESRAVPALDALLPGGTAPFTGAAAFRGAAGPAPAPAPAPVPAPAPARTRVSCCLFYTLRPAESCVGCPRTRL
ncbi:(2Fe-2S)-binding protein [Kitasatospora azatica]|uniref:(2Fe-2S)-binding protein n=1 Tax=Kitasatospora azatica TaxID=58347 RepID=UPI00055AD784|nr:(2Fe-2S)-binding protein [Kitasatospora azatica]